MNTKEALIKKYGVMLSMENVAEILNYKSVRGVREAIANKTLKITVKKVGKRNLIHVDNMAKYIDGLKK